jgi:hypothetical protein
MPNERLSEATAPTTIRLNFLARQQKTAVPVGTAAP